MIEEGREGPWDDLPRLGGLQARFESRLLHARADGPFRASLDWLLPDFARTLTVGPPEVQWRASGTKRSGANVHLSWPRLNARIGIGVEPPIVHAVVDELLGFERLAGEDRLAVSPVEWGIWTYLVTQSLARLGATPGPLGDFDLSLGRVGPEEFDVSGQGTTVTVRWPVALGKAQGGVRLWLPGGLVARWVAAVALPTVGDLDRFGPCAAEFRAEAGTVLLKRGRSQLRLKSVLPLMGVTLQGTPGALHGRVSLRLDLPGGRHRIEARLAPDGASVVVEQPRAFEALPREPIAMNAPQDPDLPLTLTIELGRVSVPLGRLAELRPGDVLQLGRHPQEPIELTSNGRLVARGELVRVDDELGLRITTLAL